MKNILKGKMVKTQRPKINVQESIDCECMVCDWMGDVESTKVDNKGHMICPNCKKEVIVYEN